MGANTLVATEPTLVGLPTEVLVTVASFLDLKSGEIRRLADAVGVEAAASPSPLSFNSDSALASMTRRRTRDRRKQRTRHEFVLSFVVKLQKQPTLTRTLSQHLSREAGRKPQNHSA